MKQPKITLGVWNRKRRNAAGKLVRLKKHTVGYTCPETGKRVRLSYATKLEAEQARDELVAKFAGDTYFNPNTNPTVDEVVEHWLGFKAQQIKPQTLKTYRSLTGIIVGPLLQGTPQERVHYALTGEKPHRDTKLLKMLGEYKVSDLATGQLRQWNSLIRNEVGEYTAKEVMKMLKSILALAEEDFGVPVCKIPSNLPSRKNKPQKVILMPDEVAKFLEYLRNDTKKGLYVAFPFLTGVRASEQLGLQWEDVDLERNTITICRVLERDGTTGDTTKTQAGTRTIPISPMLRNWLLEWRLVCPRLDGKLYRVFGGPGQNRA